jgi:peptidyl-prolyl cis-trans isomerase C
VNSITRTKCIAVALCSVALFACQGTPGSSTAAKQEGQVLAEVNGKKITSGDFSREVKNLPEYLRAMATTPQGRKEMLDTMVIRELILQKASKDGLDKGPEIEEKLQELKKRLIVEAFLKKKVETDAQISDADLKKFYDQNIDKFKAGEQIRASHILVKSEKEAKEILAQLKGGASFEELARKNSVDSSSAKGGDLGWFGKGAMVPVFEHAALALKEGQVSDVVKSDFGFHIIKLTGKRPAGTRPFDEVRDQIKAALMPSKQQEIFQKIKDELKKSAKITIKEDALNAMDGQKSEPAQPAAPEKK